ncbi:hypothetical protein ACJ41O_007035 [Fusarium nematophilum]
MMACLNHSSLPNASFVLDEPPPSYEENQSPPRYEAPPPPQLSSSSQGEKQPPPLPRQFPPAFNLYKHSGLRHPSYTLGEYQDQPLYLYASHGAFSSLPPVLLHSGPTDSHPPLASADFQFFGSSFKVEIPAAPGSTAPVAHEPVASVSCGLLSSGFRFAIEVGPDGKGPREAFEWRRSVGDTVASLGGDVRGWKLVRMAQGPPGGGGGEFVPGGFTDSRGNEIIAAWALASGCKGNKHAHFRFMGTGLTGLLGERWAVMAVITALALFHTERRANGGCGGAPPPPPPPVAM